MRAVVYSRISDDPTGRAAGVERQVQECRALAEARGITDLDVIEDNDTSATSGKPRPGFARLLTMLEAGEVDTVIVWHTDRLYRLPRDLEPIIALTDTRRIRFLTVTASEIDLNTSSGRMVARMLAAASAQEVEHKAERQRSASDQRAARGLPTARPGYGYRRDGDRVVIEPDEADVLRTAAARVLTGESLRSIVADLNARGVPSPSAAQVARQVAGGRPTKVTVRPWDASALGRALRRPSLVGQRVHRGQVVGAAQHEAILDTATGDRLHALLSDPTRGPGKVGRGPQHLLSGIALCGACGGPLYRHPGWKPKPTSKTRHAVSPAYACPQCRRVRRSQDAVDQYVTEVIVQRLERPDAAALFDRRDDGAWTRTRTELDAVDARLATAADSYADGDIDRQQLARITATLRTKRDSLEGDLRRALPAAVPTAAVGARARDAWDSMTLDQRRAVIRALVTVTILPSRSSIGRRDFDPAGVAITWA